MDPRVPVRTGVPFGRYYDLSEQLKHFGAYEEESFQFGEITLHSHTLLLCYGLNRPREIEVEHKPSGERIADDLSEPLRKLVR